MRMMGFALGGNTRESALRHAGNGDSQMHEQATGVPQVTLWIVNHYLGLPGESSGVRHISLGRRLVEEGWRVELIGASTDHRTGRQRSTWARGRKRRVIDRVGVSLVHAPAYSGNGLGRVFNMLVFAVRVLLGSSKAIGEPQVVIGSTVHPLAAIAGAVLARRHRAKFVYEIRDFWPETQIRLGVLQSTSLLARLLYFMERWCWAHADLILTPLAGAGSYARLRGYPEVPILHIPNGVDTSEFPVAALPPDERRRLIYMGAHGLVNELDVLVDALSRPELRSRAQDFELILCGDGPHKKSLMARVGLEGLANIRFIPPVLRSQLPEFLAQAHAFVMPMGEFQGLYQFGASPNKLADYLAAGRAVILNADFPGCPVSEAVNGFLVVESSADAWAQTLLRFLDQSDVVLADMGSRARLTAEQELDFVRLGAILNSELRELCRV